MFDLETAVQEGRGGNEKKRDMRRLSLFDRAQKEAAERMQVSLTFASGLSTEASQ